MAEQAQPIKTITRADLDAMLRHLLRCPDVMQRSLSKLRLEDFDPVAEKSHKLIYSIASQFYMQHHRLVPVELMYTEIQSRTHAHPDFDAETVASILKLAYEFYAIPAEDKQLVSSWALSTMHSFLHQRRVHSRMVQHAEQYGNQGPDILDELVAARSSAAVHMGASVEPFGDESFLGTTPRDPTGIQFLDATLGGGTRPAELYGFIAPSGGGKTTFSHQLGVSCAGDHKHIFVFSYEESPRTNEYMVPVYSAATGLQRDVFDKADPWTSMNDDQRRLFDAARQKIGRYLHYVDMSGSDNYAGRGGAHELDSYLLEQQNMGIEPHGVIVDWLWPMFRRYFADYEVDRKKMLEERGLAQQIMDDLKQVATWRKCWIWVNHQVAPASTNKKKPMDWTDAAEFKSFAWLVNACFGLGLLDEKYITQFNCSKNRSFRTSKLTVQLKGEICSFEALSGDYKWSARKKGFVKDGEETKVPDTSGPAGEPVGSTPPAAARERANYEGDRVDM